MMIKWPSINQFRNVVKYARLRAQYVGRDGLGNAIYDETITDAPTITYRLTPKLHGTNAGIGFDVQSGVVWYQSRENVLSEGADNAQFRQTFIAHEEDLREHFRGMVRRFDIGAEDTVVIFGEWCGQGIQKGVAISELPRMFVVFGARIQRGGNAPVDLPLEFLSSEELLQHTSFGLIPGIKYICVYPSWTVEVDFERPEESQNAFVELCTAIEAECPVGKHHGVSGVGEGFVAIPKHSPDNNDSNYWFKVKGEKHSVSKVKTLAAVDVEAVENMRAFIGNTVTDARCEQALDNLTREQGKAFEMQSIGDFIRWIVADIVKEESDTAEASGIDIKKIGGAVAPAAKKWYIAKLNANL